MLALCPLTIGNVILALAALSAAEPIVKRATLKKNFYLFGSPLKSTAAANATALGVVDLYFADIQILTPDYSSQFNLTRGVLQTPSTVHPFNVLVPFGSNIDSASGVLFFTEGNGTHGLFEFKKSFLALKGDTDHWTSCRGEYVLPAIYYNGTDPSCTPVYIFQT